MTKKFVRNEWDAPITSPSGRSVGIHRPNGFVEASPSLLNLFQSFEERIENLQANEALLEEKIEDLHQRIKRLENRFGNEESNPSSEIEEDSKEEACQCRFCYKPTLQSLQKAVKEMQDNHPVLGRVLKARTTEEMMEGKDRKPEKPTEETLKVGWVYGLESDFSSLVLIIKKIEERYQGITLGTFVHSAIFEKDGRTAKHMIPVCLSTGKPWNPLDETNS